MVQSQDNIFDHQLIKFPRTFARLNRSDLTFFKFISLSSPNAQASCHSERARAVIPGAQCALGTSGINTIQNNTPPYA